MTKVKEQIYNNLEVLKDTSKGLDPILAVGPLTDALVLSTILLYGLREEQNEAKRDTKRQMVQTNKTKRTRKRNARIK